MDSLHKARRLSEVVRFVDVTPLPWGDDRYVDVSEGRGPANELDLLGRRLCQYSAKESRFAKVAFTGTRGGGKTTELLRLEHRLADRFTSVHVYVDESLYSDCGFAELFLWIVDELVRKFEQDDMPLSVDLAADVARWFYEVTEARVDQVVSEVAAEAGGNAEAKTGLFWLSLGLFARLKSQIKGSTDRRREIRGKLQQRATELVDRVNLLLDDAQRVLAAQKKPADLLIVVDNIDRFEPDVGRKLFFRHGDILKLPKAHVVYTVPNAVDLAPMNIATVFEDKFSLSTVKVRNPSGKPRQNKKGIDALVRLVAERIEIDAVFENRRDVRKLVEMSGGSLRDIMRLLLISQLVALGDGAERIRSAHVKLAMHRMQLDFERSLFPGATYYPLLAEVHHTKRESGKGLADADPKQVQDFQVFFSRLLFSGTILEYNGDRMWYDVHPLVQEISAFKKALAHVQAQARPEAGPQGDEG